MYRRTNTKLSYNARRILELLNCFQPTATAPNAKTISSNSLAMEWGETHRLLEQLHEDGMVMFTVSSEHGSQYFITPRGETFL